MRTLAYEQIIELANMVAADINIPHIPEDQLRNHFGKVKKRAENEHPKFLI